MAEYSKADRQVARAIVMAQIASDAGKGRIWRDPIPIKSTNVPKYGYGLKESMITRALVMINTQKESVWRYYVELAPDQNGFKSVLVYFETRDPTTGKKLQVSFHNPFWKSQYLPNWIGKGRKTRWNKRVGGSREDCDRIIAIFNLDKHE